MIIKLQKVIILGNFLFVSVSTDFKVCKYVLKFSVALFIVKLLSFKDPWVKYQNFKILIFDAFYFFKQ